MFRKFKKKNRGVRIVVVFLFYREIKGIYKVFWGLGVSVRYNMVEAEVYFLWVFIVRSVCCINFFNKIIDKLVILVYYL